MTAFSRRLQQTHYFQLTFKWEGKSSEMQAVFEFRGRRKLLVSARQTHSHLSLESSLPAKQAACDALPNKKFQQVQLLKLAISARFFSSTQLLKVQEQHPFFFLYWIILRTTVTSFYTIQKILSTLSEAYDLGKYA